MSGTIRRARDDDMAAIVALLASASPHPWTAVQVNEELARAGALCQVMATDAGVAAVLLGFTVVDEWHILEVATSPSERRRGHARALLLAGCRQARERACTTCLLEARASNAPALALYRSLGFTEVGRRARYYAPDGEDAVLLTAGLPFGP